MKTAVIFHRLGPYHFARLRAAGRLLPVTAIETSGADETYAWDVIAGADGFERVTLLENADAQKQPAHEVARRMKTVLEKIRPSVVVVPGWADSAALAALQWCGRNRIPAVIMSESTAWDEPRQPWKEFIKRQIVGLASAALAGGTPHRDYLVQLGLPAERVFLGYDAVDNDYFARSAKEVSGRKSEVGSQRSAVSGQRSVVSSPSSLFPLPSSPSGPVVSGQRSEVRSPISDLRSPPSGPYFLASARFVEKKNLPRLIQAYARYRQLVENEENRKQKAENQDQFQLSEFQLSAFSPWPLVLVGDGPLRSDLCHLISGLRLQSSILLPGFKQYPELPAFYASAGAFIHASTTEQWGLVVNEAMASGLPVLVSNRCGCATDLVQAGVNGFTFDPCDVEQLAQLMLKISAFKAFSSPPRPGRGTQGEVSNSDSNPPSALSRQSSILHPPSSTLAEMGAASREIIADWGPERFAAGLKAAAECALKVGPVKPSLLQRVLLTALLRR